MKKLFLIVLLIVVLSNAHGQATVYHPFPDDSATWVTDNYSNICMGYCGSNYYRMKGDTIINGISYNKLYHRYGQFYYISPPPNTVVGASFSACAYAGAIREDVLSKKIYFIDSTLTTDTLLYDFNIAVGDTLPDWFSKGTPPYPLVVSSVDSVLVNGSYHKRFNFQNLASANNLCLVEGIGWTGDLLYGLLYSPNGATNLACYNGNPVGIPWTAIVNECTASLNCNTAIGLNEPATHIGVKVFPNPFSNKLNVQLNAISLSRIIIYDIAAKKILQHQFADTISIDTHLFAKGLYFYEVQTPNNIVSRGKIIKE